MTTHDKFIVVLYNEENNGISTLYGPYDSHKLAIEAKSRIRKTWMINEASTDFATWRFEIHPLANNEPVEKP